MASIIHSLAKNIHKSDLVVNYLRFWEISVMELVLSIDQMLHLWLRILISLDWEAWILVYRLVSIVHLLIEKLEIKDLHLCRID